jgi:hypothetical protein
MKITMKDGTLVRPKQYVNSYDIIMLCHMANIDHPKHLNRAYTDLLNRHGKLETSHIDYEDGTFVFAA